MPDVTDDAIIHEFRLTGSNNLIVAPNTIYSEHKHENADSPPVFVVILISQRQGLARE
jgi:hypothetical protein